MKRANDFEREKEHIFVFLGKTDPGTEEYAQAVKSLRDLVEIRTTSSSFKINPDVILAAGVNILTVAMILYHENLNVLTTKAVAFVGKLRLL